MLVNVGNITVGDDPRGVASADFDGDGDIDLAVTANDTSSVSILLNNGDGTFTAGAVVSSTATPPNNGAYFIVTADVNRDGKADLLVSNDQQGSMSILLGDGAGGFTHAAGSPTALLTGTHRGIATGDFNGDNVPDVIVADYNNSFLHIQLGDGAGGTTAAPGSAIRGTGVAPFYSLPTSVAVGDVNRDGHQDFVVSNEFLDTVDLYVGDGTGAFTLEDTWAAGTGPADIVLGDLDGDGDLDAVAANFSTDQVRVLLLDGAGGLTSSTGFAAGDGPISVTLLDVNFDGRLDIVATALNTDRVTVLLGNGDGTFAAPSSITVGDEPSDLRAADLNGDGHTDLAVVNRTGTNIGTVSILLSTGFEIAEANSSGVEGNAGTSSFTFTVTRFGSTAGAATVDWAVTGSGSGAGGANAADFVGGVFPSGTVNFANGQSTATITVDVVGDTVLEDTERFTVTLSNASGGLDIATATAQGAILADDSPPGLGTSGDDFAVLDGTGTTYSALGGDDRVFALDGDDWVHGNAGNDYVNGGAGNDFVYGGQGNDEVLGEYGDDRLFGDAGNDNVQGGPGSDTCEGGQGDDWVRGGQGDDWVLGGAGMDFVSGDRGNDTLTGGADADWFHIFAGAGADIVTDFNRSQGDTVWVAAGSTWTISQSGSDTVVTLNDGTTLTLTGVTASTLTDGWIFSA